MNASNQSATLSEFELIRINRLCEDFCTRRCPAELHQEVRLTWRIHKNLVTLIEERARFNCPGAWVELPIARFERSDAAHWHLYAFNRNGRPLPYAPCPDAPDFARLLEEVAADPFGIFFG